MGEPGVTQAEVAVSAPIESRRLVVVWSTEGVGQKYSGDRTEATLSEPHARNVAQSQRIVRRAASCRPPAYGDEGAGGGGGAEDWCGNEGG